MRRVVLFLSVVALGGAIFAAQETGQSSHEQEPELVRPEPQDEDGCLYCKDEYDTGKKQPLKMCAAGHEMCLSCSCDWFVKEKKEQCPLCRAVVGEQVLETVAGTLNNYAALLLEQNKQLLCCASDDLAVGQERNGRDRLLDLFASAKNDGDPVIRSDDASFHECSCPEVTEFCLPMYRQLIENRTGIVVAQRRAWRNALFQRAGDAMLGVASYGYLSSWFGQAATEPIGSLSVLTFVAARGLFLGVRGVKRLAYLWRAQEPADWRAAMLDMAGGVSVAALMHVTEVLTEMAYESLYG